MAKAMFATLIACFVTIGVLAGEHEAAEPRHDVAHEAAHEPAVAKASPKRPGYWQRFYETSVIGQFIEEFRLKVERAAHYDQENDQLRARISEMEVRFGELEDEAVKCREQARAEKIKAESKEEGGVESARTIASLKTFDEKLLSRPPKTIYEEAMRAFSADDYETSGKALAFLADNQENDAYQTVQVFYLTGVSLYKVGNYKRALAYLEKARGLATGEELAYAPRALGWMALCYKKLGDVRGEKQAIKDLIEKFPKSKEARRLNRNA